MRRLTHHQYTRISMLEDVLAEFEDHRDRPGLYVDTWKPTISGEGVRVSVIAEEAVVAGPGAEVFAEFVLNLEIASDGQLIDEDGVLPAEYEYPTMTQVRDFLAAHFTTED